MTTKCVDMLLINSISSTCFLLQMPGSVIFSGESLYFCRHCSQVPPESNRKLSQDAYKLVASSKNEFGLVVISWFETRHNRKETTTFLNITMKKNTFGESKSDLETHTDKVLLYKHLKCVFLTFTLIRKKICKR